MRAAPLPQRELALDHEAAAQVTLRWAHARSGVRMSYEEALRHPLIRRCLENVVHAANSRGRR